MIVLDVIRENMKLIFFFCCLRDLLHAARRAVHRLKGRAARFPVFVRRICNAAIPRMSGGNFLVVPDQWTEQRVEQMGTDERSFLMDELRALRSEFVKVRISQ